MTTRDVRLFLHDHACIRIVITEGCGVLHLSRTRTCEVGSLGIPGRVSHVPRWGLPIVHPGCVWMRNLIVRHVRPHDRPLTRPMLDTVEHFLGVHVADDRQLVQLRLDHDLTHSSHSFHRLPHHPLASFAVNFHLYLHRLIQIPTHDIISAYQPLRWSKPRRKRGMLVRLS